MGDRAGRRGIHYSVVWKKRRKQNVNKMFYILLYRMNYKRTGRRTHQKIICRVPAVRLGAARRHARNSAKSGGFAFAVS